jgi:flavin-dependent dehydrogenase
VERLFVLGDAAGYVEPFTGEGIAWALLAGRSIEPLARRAVYGWDPELPRLWAALYARLVGRRQRLCRALTQLVRHPRLARGALELSLWIPGFTGLLINHVNAPFVASRLE